MTAKMNNDRKKMRSFINYSLHFVERCSIKVQCNRLIPKPSLSCAFYKGALGVGGKGWGGRGGEEAKKNWLGRQDRLKIFDLGQFQR